MGRSHSTIWPKPQGPKRGAGARLPSSELSEGLGDPSRWSGHALLRPGRSRAALRLGPSGVDRCRGARGKVRRSFHAAGPGSHPFPHHLPPVLLAVKDKPSGTSPAGALRASLTAPARGRKRLGIGDDADWLLDQKVQSVRPVPLTRPPTIKERSLLRVDPGREAPTAAAHVIRCPRA